MPFKTIHTCDFKGCNATYEAEGYGTPNDWLITGHFYYNAPNGLTYDLEGRFCPTHSPVMLDKLSALMPVRVRDRNGRPVQ